jgi:O-antigen/teichoic acid export membrane protein
VRRLASNAAANAANGLTTAAYQVLLTGLVSRQSAPEEFSAWSLAFSVAAMAPLLSCNMSMALTRRLSHHIHGQTNIDGTGQSVMVAGRELLKRITAIGVLLAVVIGLVGAWLYADRFAVNQVTLGLLFAISFAGALWIVPAQLDQGYFQTKAQNWQITWAGIVARLSSLAVFWLSSNLAHWSLTACILAASGALWLGTWTISRHRPPLPATLTSPLEHVEVRELTGLLKSFSTMSIGTAAIQASTIPLISFLSPSSATSAFAGFTICSILVGGMAAVGNAAIAPIAKLVASGERDAARRLAARGSVVLWTIFVACALVAWMSMNLLLPHWLSKGAVDPGLARHYFVFFASQQAIRSAGITFSGLVSMSCPPRQIVIAPLAEGFGGLISMLLLGLAWPGGLYFLAGLPAAAALGLCILGRQSASVGHRAAVRETVTILCIIFVTSAMTAAAINGQKS